ncbi:MFS transporter [Actinomadura barringtoniae]|uniref:MFS transporter n=2 Tax=Actinomadura barringtoniae TaxID=1427535 RepID=A0A939T5Z9_9ACTN|nr:MFS transporter [Actinomadura barringtoniae]
MIGVDTSVVTIALPGIRDALHLSTSGLTWVQNSYMLTFGGLLLLGGRTGDIFGRRRVFAAGVVVFTLASLLGGVATSGGMLIAARALQGVAAAVAAPSAMALIAANFEGAARVRALSIFSGVTGAGAAIGMLVGGVLTEAASWRWVFFINLPVGLALAVLGPRFITETPRRPGRFDIAGTVTSVLGMTALVFGFIRAGSDGWRDGLTIGAFAASIVLLAAFVAVEARVRQPIVPLRLFRDRDRSGAYLAMPLYVSGMFGAFFFLTQYLQEVLGYGPLRAGVAFLPMVGMQFTVLRILPRVLPRFGARPFVVTGAILVGLGLLWLSRVSADSGYVTGMLGPFLMMGAGGGIAIMPLNMTVLAKVPAEDAGAASGVAQAVIWLGASLGSAVLVTVFGAATRHTTGDPAHVMVHGLDVVFASGAAFALAALLVVLVALRPQRKQEQPAGA